MKFMDAAEVAITYPSCKVGWTAEPCSCAKCEKYHADRAMISMAVDALIWRVLMRLSKQ